MVPASAIPSTGRGNSEDGQEWLNPSPYQLHRALKRKGKAIPKEESFEVAAVHEMVTNATWDCIMEYESMYKDSCGAPKLARYGQFDIVFGPFVTHLSALCHPARAV